MRLVSAACRMFGRLAWGRLIVLLFGGPLWIALAIAPAHAATYSSMATTSNWVNPSAHTRVTWTNGASCSSGYAGAPIDDDITAQLPLGFTFNFGGVNYTQVQVMSNGRLQFNNGYCGYGTQTVGPPPTYPYPYPNASVSRTMRVYGVDLDATPSGAPGGVSHCNLLCELRHRGDRAQSPLCRDLGERPGVGILNAYRQLQPAGHSRGNDQRIRLPVRPEQPSHRRVRANRLAAEPDGLCGVVHARRATREFGGAVLCAGADR